MRAFKLITFVVAIFGAEKLARADEDLEVIDLDATEAPPALDLNEQKPDDLPEPEMPENPYGNIDLATIVSTGTLDGVNKPSTPEEEEVLQALMNFHHYTEASQEIDASFGSLMDELKMDDLQDMIAKATAGMDSEADDFTKELHAKIDGLTNEHLDNTFTLGADAIFDIDEIERKMREQLKKVTDRLDHQFDDILGKLDEAEAKIRELPEDTDIEQWLRENPEYDPKNMRKLQEGAKQAASAGGGLDMSNILKEVGRIGSNPKDPSMDELERVFAEQVAKLEGLKAGIDTGMNIDALMDEL